MHGWAICIMKPGSCWRERRFLSRDVCVTGVGAAAAVRTHEKSMGLEVFGERKPVLAAGATAGCIHRLAEVIEKVCNGD